ncbi:hypothetical protein ACF0H5_018493 [Mactra antiquata]
MKEKVASDEQDGFKTNELLQANIGTVENMADALKDSVSSMLDVSNDIKGEGDNVGQNISEQNNKIKLKNAEHQKLCLIELTYTCKDCLKSFDLIEDLQKHIGDDNKCSDLSDVSCENRLESPSVNDELPVTETAITTNLSKNVLDGIEVSTQDSLENDDVVDENDDETVTEMNEQCKKYNNEDKSCSSKENTNCVTDTELIEPSNVQTNDMFANEDHESKHSDIDVKIDNKFTDMKNNIRYNTVKEELDDTLDEHIDCSDNKKDTIVKFDKEFSQQDEQLAVESSPGKRQVDDDQNKHQETDKVETKCSQRLRIRKSSEHKSRNLQYSEEVGVTKKRTSTQAKNDLTNPSKGKRKRIRDTENLNKEDEAFMKAFGIIQSKVCLNRVKDTEFEDIKNESVSETKTSNIIEKHKEVCLNSKVDNVKQAVKNDTVTSKFHVESKELDKLNVEMKDDNVINEVRCSSDQSDEKMTFTRSRKKQLVNSKPITKSSSKNDDDLLKQFGLKEMTIRVTKSPVKTSVWVKPGPRCKTMPTKIKMTALPDGQQAVPPKSTIEVDTMSEDEMQEMLRKCGMAISVPIPHSSTDNITSKRDKVAPAKRKASPEPSTSHGHGHLQRSKTARKSVNDSALFDKYKLKDSKVILKNLSRIDISLLRNPNSPFGKSDWLKHKFDSDSDSDMEWDIPTPPIMEDFIENPRSQSDTLKKLDSKSCERSPQKCSDSQILEKFGINESIVVLESPRKKDGSPLKVPVPPSASCVNESSSSKYSLSDAELMRKFGLPEVKVVLSADKNSSQSHNVSEQSKKSEEEPFKKLDFSQFRSVVDDACKNILSKLKNLNETNAIDSDKIGNINDNGKKRQENVTIAVKRSSRFRKTRNDDRKKHEDFDAEKTSISNDGESPVQCTVKNLNKHSRNINTKKQNMDKGCIKSVSSSSIVSAKERVSTRLKRLKQLKSVKKVSNSLALSIATRNRNSNCSEKAKRRDNEKASVKESPHKSTLRSNKSSSSVVANESKNIPELVKSLPVVHVKVPVLSDADILKLTKQNKTVVNDENEPHLDIDDDSELIVKDILNKIIDRIDCSLDIPVTTDEDLTVQYGGINESCVASQQNDLKKFEMEQLTNEIIMKQNSVNDSVVEFVNEKHSNKESDTDDSFAIEKTSLDSMSNDLNAASKTSQNCEADDSNSCIETEISLISDYSYEENDKMTEGKHEVGGEKYSYEENDKMTEGKHEVGGEKYSYEENDKMTEGKDEVDGEKYVSEDKLEHCNENVQEGEKKEVEKDVQCTKDNDLLDEIPIGVSKFFDDNDSEMKGDNGDDVDDMERVNNDDDNHDNDDNTYDDENSKMDNNDDDNHDNDDNTYDDENGKMDNNDDDNHDNDDNTYDDENGKMDNNDDDNHNNDDDNDNHSNYENDNSNDDDNCKVTKTGNDCRTDVIYNCNEIESESKNVDIAKFEPLQVETVPREQSLTNSNDIVDGSTNTVIGEWYRVKED